MAVNYTSSGPIGGVAFSVKPSVEQSNLGVATIVWPTEVFDVGSNFASNTFTAPVTGKYQLNTNIRIFETDTAASYYEMSFMTSNRNYYSILSPKFASDPQYWTFSLSVLADMDASDTVTVRYNQSGGTAQTDVYSASFFSGYLVA